MKTIKSLAGLALFYILLFSTGAQFSSCTKETLRDTIRDTIIKRDTITLHDTTDCTDLTDGLVAYYPFTNGSLKDSSGNNNDIYFNTALPAPDRFGKANNAYEFNSLNHAMRVKSSASLNPPEITIMAIVKVKGFYAGTCHSNAILGKGNRDDVNGFYYMRFQDGNCTPGAPVQANREFFSAGIGDNNPLGRATGAAADTSYITLDQWYTVIYTYDGIVSKIFINGALKSVKLLKVAVTPNNFDLFIGKHEDPAFPYSFNGVIDEIRIYKKAISPEQVTSLSNLKK